MTTLDEVRAAVEHSFTRDASHLERWPAPHPDREPLDDEYSRVLDPAKWRIVTARAEAWCDALVRLGVARLDRDIDWDASLGHPLARVDRLVPVAEGAIPLVLGYRSVGADLDSLVLALGEPAQVTERLPVCGCDACDDGADAVLIEVDDAVVAAITGALRCLTRGEATIVATARGWSASNVDERTDIDAVLADPVDWNEVSGRSWLASDAG